MSTPVPSHHMVLVRQADAEVVGAPPVSGRLYADSSATGGALTSQRITLLHGAAGATPHHHTGSSELFYVISGAAEMLTGERVLTAGEGDLLVVPPGTVHAFAAARDSDADLLIILVPGVERFEYFRQLQRIAAGEAPLESILQPKTSTTITSTTARSGSRRSQPACKLHPAVARPGQPPRPLPSSGRIPADGRFEHRQGEPRRLR